MAIWFEPYHLGELRNKYYDLTWNWRLADMSRDMERIASDVQELYDYEWDEFGIVSDQYKDERNEIEKEIRAIQDEFQKYGLRSYLAMRLTEWEIEELKKKIAADKAKIQKMKMDDDDSLRKEISSLKSELGRLKKNGSMKDLIREQAEELKSLRRELDALRGQGASSYGLVPAKTAARGLIPADEPLAGRKLVPLDETPRGNMPISGEING